jgi:RNA polymerase sigma-70 factor (ECF subfamily)
MRFAASLVGPSEAGDLVSEVVVATLQHRSLSSLDNPRAYLMQAVLNRARSRGRHLERERRALARHGTPSVPDPAEVISDVTQAVAGLPPQQRAAIFLVYWEDMVPSEVARMLGLRPGTIRRYLHLARKRLGRLLDD